MLIYAFPASVPVSPFYAFEQSDNFGRAVVFLLFCASIIAWTIMIDKWLSLRKKRSECTALKESFKAMSIGEYLSSFSEFQGPMTSITQTACEGIAELFSLNSVELLDEIRTNGVPGGLGERELRRVRSMIESQVDNEIIEIEQRLGLLSSIVSASPFLGLLGTVWGVMMAFTGMAMHGKADISAIAPGVSGALLTTVVGLLVAIPAVIGYNILVNQVKEVTVDLDNFAENLVTKIEIASRDFRDAQ